MDLTLIALVLLNAVTWLAAGATICTLRHRQRGLDTDTWDVVVPDSPADLVDA